jgi:hypothetical protein
VLPRRSSAAGDDVRAGARHDAVVTREQAIERVRKLHAVTVQRGATEHEAAVAAERATRLAARFGLSRPASAPAPAHASIRRATQSYATAARTDRRAARSLRFVRSA